MMISQIDIRIPNWAALPLGTSLLEIRVSFVFTFSFCLYDGIFLFPIRFYCTKYRHGGEGSQVRRMKCTVWLPPIGHIFSQYICLSFSMTLTIFLHHIWTQRKKKAREETHCVSITDHAQIYFIPAEVPELQQNSLLIEIT